MLVTLLQTAAGGGTPQVVATGSGAVQATVVAGRTYLIEVGAAAAATSARRDLPRHDHARPVQRRPDADRCRRGEGRPTDPQRLRPPVAVLDTGIDPTTPGLGGRVILAPDFGDPRAASTDTVGHGTFIAGVLAGQTAYAPGIAPGADLISLKITPNHSDSASVDSIYAALQWVLNNRAQYNIVAVNLSFALGNADKGQALAELEPLYEQLEQAGVFIAAASGNNYAADAGQLGVSELAASDAVAAGRAVWDACPPVRLDQRRQGLQHRPGPDRVVHVQRDAGLDLLPPGGDVLGLDDGRNADSAERHVGGNAVRHRRGVARQAADQLGLASTPAGLLAVRRTGVVVTDAATGSDNVPHGPGRGLLPHRPGRGGRRRLRDPAILALLDTSLPNFAADAAPRPLPPCRVRPPATLTKTSAH